jgi:hypothetical protein
MNGDNHFFEKQLLDAPPVPDSVFPAIQAQLRQRDIITKGIWTVSVVLILATGFSLQGLRSRPVSAPVTNIVYRQSPAIDDANAELISAYVFINGTAIENELQEYALVDPEIF